MRFVARNDARRLFPKFCQEREKGKLSISKDNVIEKKEEISEGFITDQKYKNVGFTLIYSDKLKTRKRSCK